MSNRLDNLDPRDKTEEQPSNPKLAKESSDDYHEKVRKKTKINKYVSQKKKSLAFQIIWIAIPFMIYSCVGFYFNYDMFKKVKIGIGILNSLYLRDYHMNEALAIFLVTGANNSAKSIRITSNIYLEIVSHTMRIE